MSATILVEKLDQPPMESREVELVERKGLGHPDYIADAIAEAVSRELCKWYIEHFGRILHHNVDKVLVVGGQAWRVFGKGEVLHPISIIVSGRVTTEVRHPDGSVEMIPVGGIILSAAKKWLRENIRYLDVERHVIVDYKIGKGSAELARLVETKVPLANDTSLGAGFAPLTETEKLVFETERLLNSPDFKRKYEFVGEDVKVMGLRIKDKIKLTVATAILAEKVASLDEYKYAKDVIKEEVLNLASKVTEKEVAVFVNTADDMTDIIGERVYLVVTGTSAEHGDDGATGRGNRANGLITPLRPMSLEATAGKNPVSHVGKVYNVLAFKIASRIYEEVNNIREVYVAILSQIGKPIDQPQVLNVSIVPLEGAKFNTIVYEVQEIAKDELSKVCELTDYILRGEALLF
ncbi:MAG: methionine adenosyltransferase [Thermoprotei archaeon]|nr:MAG: methionine adenosyltransferase [Thermoprotei archaeon]